MAATKIRNEILWVTGIILGVLTILEAFTGYDIIFSERAETAISIATSLTNSIPVLGPDMREAFWRRFFRLYLEVLRIPCLLASTYCYARSDGRIFRGSWF